MDTIFMNYGNGKTSDPHRILFNLTDKTNLAISDKCVVYQTLVFIIR